MTDLDKKKEEIINVAFEKIRAYIDMCATKEHVIKHLQMTIDEYAKTYALEMVGEDEKDDHGPCFCEDCSWVACRNKTKQEIRDRINNS